MNLLERLLSIKDRYLEVSKNIIDPDVIADQKRYTEYMREYKELGRIVESGDAYEKVCKDLQGAKDILYSKDFRLVRK